MLEEFDGYDEWIDSIQGSEDADIAGEQFQHDLTETSKLLAGGHFESIVGSELMLTL